MQSSSWLCLPPLGAFTETWLSSVFIGSCPGLTSNGEWRGLPTTAADGLLYRTSVTIDLEKACVEFYTGGSLAQKHL